MASQHPVAADAKNPLDTKKPRRGSQQGFFKLKWRAEAISYACGAASGQDLRALKEQLKTALALPQLLRSKLRYLYDECKRRYR